MKALVAFEYSILTTGEVNSEPGPDYFAKRRPARTRARAVQQREELGYTVTLEPLTHTSWDRGDTLSSR